MFIIEVNHRKDNNFLISLSQNLAELEANYDEKLKLSWG